jgi:hypothetical protein
MTSKAIVLAALIGLAPVAAFAQANVDAGAAGGVGAAATSGAGQVDVNADFNAFLQGLGTADYTSAQSGIDTATTFNVVKLSSMANADATKLKDATTPHEADIASIGAKLDANASAKAALDAAGVTSANVVWIETGADGAVTLYVNDLPAAM